MCHLDYGDFVVESSNKAIIDRLDRLHTRALRCIDYQLDLKGGSDIQILYHKYKLEPLESRRKVNLLKIMYSASRDEVNIDMYRPQRVLCSTSNVKLKHKFTRLTKIQKSFSPQNMTLKNKSSFF